ncbi:hypothetical protein GCM10027020_17000 [Nocardioides salsibiostraticola]
MTRPTTRDPFGPLEAIVTALLSLLIAASVGFGIAAVVAAAQGEGIAFSIATIGDGQTCITIDNQAPTPSVSTIRQRGVDTDKASLRVEDLELCLKEPSATQEFLSSLKPVGDLIFAIGGLALVRRAIDISRRNGIFTPASAGRVRTLGWFMLVMTLPWPLVVAAGNGVLISAAIPKRDFVWGLINPDLSIALVVVSLGVISVARVLQRGAALQEDVDATV